MDKEVESSGEEEEVIDEEGKKIKRKKLWVKSLTKSKEFKFDWKRKEIKVHPVY